MARGVRDVLKGRGCGDSAPIPSRALPPAPVLLWKGEVASPTWPQPGGSGMDVWPRVPNPFPGMSRSALFSWECELHNTELWSDGES